MSTSCIIALYSKSDNEIILLEKTHDGFFETVKFLLSEAVTECGYDLEYIANYLIKKTDVSRGTMAASKMAVRFVSPLRSSKKKFTPMARATSRKVRSVGLCWRANMRLRFDFFSQVRSTIICWLMPFFSAVFLSMVTSSIQWLRILCI